MFQRLKIVVMLGGSSAERGRGEGVAVARSLGGRAGSQNAGLDFAAGHGGRLPRAVARHLWRGRHGAAAARKTRRAFHGLRFGSEPHRVRQGFDEAKVHRGRRADGEICGRQFGKSSAAGRFAIAAGRETGATGFERRSAICRARGRLARCDCRSVEI